MVPEGWSKLRLDEVCPLQRGFDLPTAKRVEGSVPVVSSSGVAGFHNASMADGPGVVTGRYGTIGQVFYMTEAYWPLNTSLWVTDFFDNHPKFIYFLLCSINYKKFSDKTGVPGVNRNDLHTIKVLVPSRREQDKIVDILSTWDRAIETVEDLIEKSELQRSALMQRLFDPTKAQAELGLKYRRLCLRDIARIDADSLSSRTDPDYSFRYVSLSDVEPGHISNKLTSHTYSDAPSRARRVIRNGDILMSTVRPNLQGFARVTEKFDECVASTGFAVLSVQDEFESDYVYHYLYSAHVTGQINSLVVGSNYPAINSSDVKGLAIYCPDCESQKRIAAALNCIDATVTNLTKQHRRLKAEKTALMQQLLTGKRRVRLDEASAKAATG